MVFLYNIKASSNHACRDVNHNVVRESANKTTCQNIILKNNLSIKEQGILITAVFTVK